MEARTDLVRFASRTGIRKTLGLSDGDGRDMRRCDGLFILRGMHQHPIHQFRDALRWYSHHRVVDGGLDYRICDWLVDVHRNPQKSQRS